MNSYIRSPRDLFQFVVFQTKVIGQLAPLTLDSDTDDDLGPTPRKKQKLQTIASDTCMHREILEDDQQRERDAIDVQKQHQKFIETQIQRAGQYVKQKHELPTVSSKLSVVDPDNIPNPPCQPGMEGKGPRIVPQVVKNYRKRLKKKRRKTNISN